MADRQRQGDTLASANDAAPATDTVAERRVTSRGAISRDRILEGALALLSEGGYSALSISAICKRADVSAASLYHHFGDKAGLLTAMIEHALTTGARRYVELVGQHDTPLAQFDAYIEATRQLGKDRVNDPMAALASLAEATGDAPELSDVIVKARARAWGLVAAETQSLFDIEDAMLTTHLQFALLTYMAHLVRTSGSTEEARDMFKSFRRVMLITMDALRPELSKDKDFAAAVAEAKASPPPSSLSSDKGET